MKIVVLAGGTSTERDVSLVSGAGVYRALKKKGHEVVLLDVYLGLDLTEEECRSIFSSERDFAEGIRPIGEQRTTLEQVFAARKDPEQGFFGPHVLEICRMADIVFLALHGMNGEDGKIQAAFDLMGIKYTGTDYVSSAMAMDKAITKDLFEKSGVLTPWGVGMKKGDPLPKDIPYPCIVKTSHGGSSVGVYRVDAATQMDKALAEAFAIEDEVVIEQFIEGHEFTDLVIDGEAYPIVMITPKIGAYDYKNKYQAGSTEEICPAPISGELEQKIKESAVAAYRALRLKVYARMDFIVDSKDQVYCLEANTLPGMTPTSLIPQEAAAAGIDYEALCEMLIRISLNKYED